MWLINTWEVCARSAIDTDLKHGWKITGIGGFPPRFFNMAVRLMKEEGGFGAKAASAMWGAEAASSAAHIYGKTKVSAESFTCAGAAYSRYPAQMKSRADRFFTEG